MNQLALWLAVCVTLAWLLRARVIYLVCLAIIIWTFVPAVAGQYVIGISRSSFAFHPATWLLLTTVAVQVLVAPYRLTTVLWTTPT
jgi:hypothetical protein